jgi:RNA polymerase sigma factor (sigma-70 family)
MINQVQAGGLVRHVKSLFSRGRLGEFREGELLDRFLSEGDESAFEELVSRHGPMALAVCRRWLSDPDEVEDAFQATFLVLVRKAHSLRRRDLLAPWLHGVARRVASRARAMALRRRSVAPLSPRNEPTQRDEPGDFSQVELASIVDEEIARLPARHRAAVVLCMLEGRTHQEAANLLKWPLGTVKSRLQWARDRLRIRLARRGLAPAAAMAVLAVSEQSSLGAGLAARTAATALGWISRGTAAGATNLPSSLSSLHRDVLNSMRLVHLRNCLLVGLAAATLLESRRSCSWHVRRLEPLGRPVRGPRPAASDVFRRLTARAIRCRMAPGSGSEQFAAGRDITSIAWCIRRTAN